MTHYEAAVQQSFLKGKYSFDAVYFNNQFHNRIDTNSTFTQYINIDKSMAQGAELTVQARPTARLQVRGAYVYDSTQILSCSGRSSDSARGSPLLLRPKALRQRSGQLHAAESIGATLAGTFIGRRPDSDFGYAPGAADSRARVMPACDAGAWYAIKRYVTAYANVENLLNQHYEDDARLSGIARQLQGWLEI